ncbi:MAG: hypothetical protein HFE78_05130 [Clostridiales bacterium]|nr:hypothetical protein [Clostridiales bacterium]
MWNEIKNSEDIKNFMEMHYYFHDSCIKELKYISGAFVDRDLSMRPINNKRILKLLIQRQFEKNPVIEMEFSGLNFMNLNPINEKYTCEIFGATMILKNGCFYWCDDDWVTDETIEQYEGTLICASKVRWRNVDQYLGEQEVYVHLPR